MTLTDRLSHSEIAKDSVRVPAVETASTFKIRTPRPSGSAEKLSQQKYCREKRMAKKPPKRHAKLPTQLCSRLSLFRKNKTLI